MKPLTKKQIKELVLNAINAHYEKTESSKKIILDIDDKDESSFSGAIGLFKKITSINTRVFDLYRFNAEACYDEDELNDPENEGLEQEWDIHIDPIIDFKPSEIEWKEKKEERTSDREFMNFWL